MTPPVLQIHDAGCRFAREDNGGHTDAARRLSDTYNLHRTLGRRGGVIAVRFDDGSSDDVVYPDRQTAIDHQHHNERWMAFVELAESNMTVCQAASVLRWQAHALKLDARERGATGTGGLLVIPRLTIEGRERQIAAMAGRVALPLALGKRK